VFDRLALPDKASAAVLLFTNISEEVAQEYVVVREHGANHTYAEARKAAGNSARCPHAREQEHRGGGRRGFSIRRQDGRRWLIDRPAYCVFPVRTFLHLETIAWLRLTPAQRR